MLDTKAWTAMLDELREAVDGLRQRLDGIDQVTTVPAADRHAIERAFDRYLLASDAVTRDVEAMLARTAPRPRR